MVRKCLILIFIISLTTVMSFAGEVGVELNGKTLVFTESSGKPMIDENNRVLVPFRLVLEAIGANVRWESEARLAIGVKDGVEVIVPIGQTYIVKNNQKILNDTSAKIIDGRTYLPIRVVLESFNYEVGWDGSVQKVIISNDPVEEDVEENVPTVVEEEIKLANTVGNTNANLYNGGVVAQEFDTMYYVNFQEGETLYSYNTKTMKSEALTDRPARQLNVVDGVLYFLEQSIYGSWDAYSMNVDGTHKKMLGSSNVNYIAAFEKGVYFYNLSEEVLYYYEYEKPYPEKMIDETMDSIQIVGGYLYFVEKEEGNTTTGADEVPVRVIRLNLDTFERKTVLEERIGDADAKVLVTEDYIYFSKYSDALTLYRTDLDGKNAIKVSDERVYYFTVDDSNAYYLNPNFDRGIIKVDIEGGNRRRVMADWSAGTTYSPLFSIVDGQLYYVKKSTSTKFNLYRLDLETEKTTKVENPSDLLK